MTLNFWIPLGNPSGPAETHNYKNDNKNANTKKPLFANNMPLMTEKWQMGDF